MRDSSQPARGARLQDRSSLGLTTVPLDRQASPETIRPHHPLVRNNGAALSVALRDEIQTLRSRSHDAEITKSSILANLSHEFRTPLNAIIGFSELMLSEAAGKIENDQHREYLDDIHASAFRLLDMVNVLLDSADVTNGLAELNRRDTDLISVIADLRDGLTSTAVSRDMKLELDTNCAICEIAIDPQRLAQAMRQVISETIRQANPGSTILVRVERQAVSVSISVSCLTFPETAKPPIRASSGAHFVPPSLQETGGSGFDLDLSIAKAVFELHGGEMSLGDSDLGALRARIILPR